MGRHQAITRDELTTAGYRRAIIMATRSGRWNVLGIRTAGPDAILATLDGLQEAMALAPFAPVPELGLAGRPSESQKNNIFPGH